MTTTHPLALLPVRIETRFGDTELRVRIFPDALHVDAHETALSPADRDALGGWRSSARDSEAWRALCAEVGAPRAAYLVTVDRDGAAPGERDGAWTRAVELRALPARWTVLVTAHGADGAVLATVRAASEPVMPPFAVGPAPGAALDPADDQVDLGPDARWLLDFDIARARGMALVIPLGAAAEADHYTVVAYGLPGRDAPAEGSAALAALLAAHCYTDGLAFLDAGMPTNHTADTAPPWASTEPPASERFASEVGAAPAVDRDGSAAAVLGAALGCGADVLARAPGATRAHAAFDRDIASVQALLWSATLGYFLEQLVDGVLPADGAAIERVRRCFVERVRNRGPLPLLRIGRQPYGVLPVTSLARWRTRASEPIDDELVGVLANLLAAWHASAARAPRVGADGDGAEHLAHLLGQAPVSTQYFARSVLGPAYTTYLYDFIRKPLGAAWWERQQTIVQRGWAAAKLPDRRHRLARTVIADTQVSVPGPVVEAAPGAAPPAYLAALAGADLATLRAAPHLPDATPLLYRLARHALLTGYLSAARHLARAAGDTGSFHDPELVGMKPRGSRAVTPSPWTWLDRVVDGGETVGALLDRLRGDAPVPAFADARAGLDRMQALPARTLDPLVREALDLCAHRADAWATAIATTRLATLRGDAPTGVHLGAYGWIERLRRTPSVEVDPPADEAGPLVAPKRDGGYIHAPSLGHATTAAVLRNGHLVHRATAASPFEIDLSSPRTTRARDLLAVVRAGHSLGAALGRRFERALVEHRAPLLGHVTPAFRQFATVDAGDGGAAVRVCDGLALVQRRGELRWGERTLPTVGSPAHAAIQPLLDELADLVDAIADLAVAESVHQLAAGHPERAALLEAMALGEPPPAALDVLDSGARGVGLEHRVLIVVPASVATTGWATTPRAQAEPALEAWSASLLGRADDYVGRVAWDDATVDLSLADLGLAALDVVYAIADLEARVLHAARARRPARVPPGTLPLLIAADGPRSLDDAIALGRALADTLGAARAATSADFGASSEADLTQLATRVADRVLDDALDALASDPAAGLLAAWHLGVAGAIPAADPAQWPAQAAAAATPLRVRADELATGVDPLRRLALLVGADVRIAPRFALDPSHLETALADQPALVGPDVDAVATWLGQVGRVRTGVGHLDRALLLADIFEPRTDQARDLRVAQLPSVAGERWIATALVRGPDGEPPGARTGLVMHAPFGLARDVAALVIDQWSEAVPRARVTTGLAFQHDQPGAQAPQAVLLAVPPDDAATWTDVAIEEILAETIQLVHARTVDSDVVRNAGHYLPALYFAINLSGDTASTDFFPPEPP